MMAEPKGGQKPGGKKDSVPASIKKGGYQPTSNPVPKNPPQGKKSGGAEGKKG